MRVRVRVKEWAGAGPASWQRPACRVCQRPARLKSTAWWPCFTSAMAQHSSTTSCQRHSRTMAQHSSRAACQRSGPGQAAQPRCGAHRVRAGMPPAATTSTCTAGLRHSAASSAAASSRVLPRWLDSRASDTSNGTAPAVHAAQRGPWCAPLGHEQEQARHGRSSRPETSAAGGLQRHGRPQQLQQLRAAAGNPGWPLPQHTSHTSHITHPTSHITQHTKQHPKHSARWSRPPARATTAAWRVSDIDTISSVATTYVSVLPDVSARQMTRQMTRHSSHSAAVGACCWQTDGCGIRSAAPAASSQLPCPPAGPHPGPHPCAAPHSLFCSSGTSSGTSPWPTRVK